MCEITWISLPPPVENSGSISSRKTNLSNISNVLKDIPFWQIWYLLQLVVSSSASNCDAICILGLSTGQLQTIYGSSGCIISPLFGSFVAFFFFNFSGAAPPIQPFKLYKPISLVYCRSTRRVWSIRMPLEVSLPPAFQFEQVCGVPWLTTRSASSY